MLSDTLEKQKKTKAGMPQSLVNKVNEPSKCSTWIFKPNLLINDFIFTSIPIQRTFVKKTLDFSVLGLFKDNARLMLT